MSDDVLEEVALRRSMDGRSARLILTASRVQLELREPEGAVILLEDRPRDAGLRIEHHSGLLRDEVIIEGLRYSVPLGSGRSLRRLLDRLEAGEGAGQPALPGEEGDLVDTQAPPEVQAQARALLQEDEQVLALVGTGEDGVWWCVTERSAARLGGEEGPRVFSPDASLEHIRSTLGRDRVLLGDAVVAQGPRLRSGRFREAVALAMLPPHARLTELAEGALSDEAYERARALLGAAARHTQSTEAAQEGGGALALSVGDARARIALLSARASLGLEDEAAAREALQALSGPGQNGISVSLELGFDDLRWWEQLALAHEAAGCDVEAAEVYLRASRLEPRFHLEAARAFQRASRTDDAVRAYDAYLEHARPEAVPELNEDASGLEALLVESPAVAACLACGALLEEAGREEAASHRYLEGLQFAPFNAELYARLGRLGGLVDDAIMARAEQIQRLLRAPGDEARRGEPWEGPAGALSTTDHEDYAIHPAEQASRHVAQRWMAEALTERADSAILARHCQPLSQGFASAQAVFWAIARALGVSDDETPRCYVSYGTTGAAVLGPEDAPFVLIGVAHLEEKGPRGLTESELAFAFGSQLEHLRAGHLLLTRSAFWSAFADRAVDSVTSLLSFIPAVAWMRRVTDQRALKWISALQERVDPDARVLRSVLELGRKGASEGWVADGAGAALDRLLQATRGEGEEPTLAESLIPAERLADFARGALYTADRVGLLMCADVGSAVRAILRLGPSDVAQRFEASGLEAVLLERDEAGGLIHAELALRLTELFKFALSEDAQAASSALHDAPLALT